MIYFSQEYLGEYYYKLTQNIEQIQSFFSYTPQTSSLNNYYNHNTIKIKYCTQIHTNYCQRSIYLGFGKIHFRMLFHEPTGQNIINPPHLYKLTFLVHLVFSAHLMLVDPSKKEVFTHINTA